MTVLDALTETEAVVDGFITAVEASIAGLRIEIAALKEALAAGGNAQPIFDEMERRLQAMTSRVNQARARL